MFIFGRIRDGEIPEAKKVFVYHISIYNEDMRHMLMAQSHVPGALTDYILQNHIHPRFVVHVYPESCFTFHLEIWENNTLIFTDTTPRTSWTAHLVTAYSFLENKTKQENPESVFVILNE